MTNALANVGLLSRMGPSLMFPGALGTGYEFEGFSTNTLLDGFHSDPDNGTAYAPALTESGMRVDLLERNEVGFYNDMMRLIHDAECAVTFRQRFGNEVFAHIPLPMTNGAWGIDEWKSDGTRIETRFRSADNRVRVLRMTPAACQLEIGWHSNHAYLKERLSVSAKGQVRTEGYDFEFFNGGIEDLACYLSLERKPGYEIALEVAQRIYNSAQYRAHELEMTPPALPQGDLQTQKVELALRDAENPGLDVVTVGWQNDEQGYLTVNLRRSSQATGFMKLAAPLKEMLWEGGLGLIY